MALYADGKGKYKNEYGELWKKLVPQGGPAETKQGEMVRLIGRLASEYYRNGNMNWGNAFNDMVVWLSNSLNDSNVFSEKAIDQINKDLMKIQRNGETGECGYVDNEDEYDRITDYVVEWCMANEELVDNDSNLPF